MEKGVIVMQRTKADFAVKTKNGIVTNVGRSSVYMPKTNFGGGSIKWHEDEPKKVHKQA